MDKAQLTRALQIAAFVVMVALAVGLYKAKSDASRARAHVRQLENEISARETDLRELRAEIARLESPANIEALAAREGLELRPGAQAAALPERAIDERLPPPRRSETR